jgi:hypothetical protein
MNDIEMNNGCSERGSDNEINDIQLAYKENNIEKNKINNKSFINWILYYFNIGFI